MDEVSGRLAVFVSRQTPFLQSCEKIRQTLKTAYEHCAPGAVRFIPLSPDVSEYELVKIGLRIAASGVDRLVLSQPEPPPPAFFSVLKAVYAGRTVPSIDIHVFGNFLELSPEWAALEETMRDMPIRFLCFSERHRRLVANLLSRPRGATTVCRPAIDDEVFKFDPELRRATRKRLGIEPSELVCLYSGRLTLQKNVTLLIRWFAKFDSAAKKPRLRLLVAGAHDDLGAEVVGRWPATGLPFQEIRKTISELPSETRKRISVLGDLDRRELAAVCNAADVGLNLSFYHGETFGLGPAEILSTGARMIVSDWAGFSSLVDPFGYCTSVPTSLNAHGAFVSYAHFKERLEKHLNAPRNDSRRAEVAGYFTERFSPREMVNRLRSLHRDDRPPPFDGFTASVRDVAIRTTRYRRNEGPLFENGMKGKTAYSKIYSPLFSESRGSR